MVTVKSLALSITCPSNITVRATSPAGAVVNYTVTTSGGCSAITVIGNPPSGSTFPIGVTTVNCTATDACGQQANCSFKVTVLRQLNKQLTRLPSCRRPTACSWRQRRCPFRSRAASSSAISATALQHGRRATANPRQQALPSRLPPRCKWTSHSIAA